MNYLKVEQHHIDAGNQARQAWPYDSSLSCPIVLAAREQLDPEQYGAHDFLRQYATERGMLRGHTFINHFDNHRLVFPIMIELLEEKVK